MTCNQKPLLKALAGQILPQPPFWLMRQAGRYLPEYREVRRQAGSFIDLCLSPDLACEVTMQPLRRYGMDGAILFSDILMVPYGLGQKLNYIDGEGPELEPITNPGDFIRLSTEMFHERLDPVYQAVKKISSVLPDTTTLIGFAGAPWTVACYMVQGSGSKEWDRVKSFAYRNPIGFGLLINLLESVTISYLDMQIKAGAEAIQLFDSWAGILPTNQFIKWVIEPTRRIVTEIKRIHPTIPFIGFARGAGLMLEEYSRSTLIDAIALDTTIPPFWAANILQPFKPVQGNLDPILVIAGGQALSNGIDEILTAFSGGPFIFNLGHGISQLTPPEHISQLANIIRSWPERCK